MSNIRRHYNKNRPFNKNNRRNGGSSGGGSSSRPSSANVAQTLQRAKQAKEKYLQLARESLAAGDRIQAESYLQYADHYTRVQNSLTREREPGQDQRFVADDATDANAGDSGNAEDAPVLAGIPGAPVAYSQETKETEGAAEPKEFLPAFLLTEV